MNRRFRQLAVTAGCCLSFANVAAATTIEEVEKSLMDARNKVKSYTAKTKMVQDVDLGGGNKMQSTMDGTIEWMRKGDKFLYRNDNKGMMTQNMSGQENKMESNATMISDGDFMYTLTEQMGQKHAFKAPVDPNISGDAKVMFAALREDSNLKVLPDEKVDGADAYVIEAMPKEAQGSPMSKTLFYFRKDNGMMVKNEAFDDKGKKIFTTTTTDIKMNTEIPAERFVFKAPAGVEVTDLTKEQK